MAPEVGWVRKRCFLCQTEPANNHGITVNIVAPGAIGTDFDNGRVRDNANMQRMLTPGTEISMRSPSSMILQCINFRAEPEDNPPLDKQTISRGRFFLLDLI